MARGGGSEGDDVGSWVGDGSCGGVGRGGERLRQLVVGCRPELRPAGAHTAEERSWEGAGAGGVTRRRRSFFPACGRSVSPPDASAWFGGHSAAALTREAVAREGVGGRHDARPPGSGAKVWCVCGSGEARRPRGVRDAAVQTARSNVQVARRSSVPQHRDAQRGREAKRVCHAVCKPPCGLLRQGPACGDAGTIAAKGTACGPHPGEVLVVLRCVRNCGLGYVARRLRKERTAFGGM